MRSALGPLIGQLSFSPLAKEDWATWRVNFVVEFQEYLDALIAELASRP